MKVLLFLAVLIVSNNINAAFQEETESQTLSKAVGSNDERGNYPVVISAQYFVDDRMFSVTSPEGFRSLEKEEGLSRCLPHCCSVVLEGFSSIGCGLAEVLQTGVEQLVDCATKREKYRSLFLQKIFLLHSNISIPHREEEQLSRTLLNHDS